MKFLIVPIGFGLAICVLALRANGEPAGVGVPPLHPRVILRDRCGQQAMFSSDGSRLLTADYQKSRLWDAVTYKPIGDLAFGAARIDRVSFVAGGRLVFTSGTCDSGPRARIARFFAAETAAPSGPEIDLQGGRRAVTSGDGKYVAESWGDEVSVLEAATSRVALSKDAAPAAGDLRLNGNGSFLVYECDSADYPQDSEMRMIRVRDGKLAFEDQLRIPKCDCQLANVAFSPDGKSVAIGDTKGFKIFDLATEKLIFDSPRLCPPIESWERARASKMEFSPDGGFLFAIRENGVHRFNCATREVRRPVSMPSGFDAFSMSRDGRYASGWYRLQNGVRQTGQGAVVVDMDTGKALWQWPRNDPGGDGCYATIAPDGRRLAVNDAQANCAYILDLGDLPRAATQPSAVPADISSGLVPP